MSLIVSVRKWWLSGAPIALLLHLGGEAQAGEQKTASYTVQSGDSLSVIAEQHHVPVALLRQVNRLADADRIRPGQVLLLAKVHEVKPGDVLGTIAEHYRVQLDELYRHNNLNDKSVLRVGQRVVIPGVITEAASKEPTQSKPEAPKPAAESKPQPKVDYYQHKVRPNEVLSKIALRYSVSTNDLRAINKLGKSSLIRVGQRLNVPITEQNAHLTRPAPPKPWHKYARKNFKRGYVTLQSLGRKWSGQALDDKGNLLPSARRGMQGMLASWRTGHKVQISERLLHMIVEVSDEFGGRPIRVVSGYREHSYSKHSRHRVGRALDFSIPGVPNSVLVDYLLTLKNTGVGYYPNSTHVHMDDRSYKMYWVDVSGPGQPPRYVHKSTKGERSKDKLAKRSKKSRKKASKRLAATKPREQSGELRVALGR